VIQKSSDLQHNPCYEKSVIWKIVRGQNCKIKKQAKAKILNSLGQY